MKITRSLPLALCGILVAAACEPAPTVDTVTQDGWDCEIPDRIASPVTISVVSDTAEARAVAVDKPVVVVCAGDPLGWRADAATIAGWEIEWDGESPLLDGASPSGTGSGEGQAATVGVFKYTVRVTTADGLQLELDPDAVIMSR